MTKEPLGNPRPPQFTLRALLVLTAVIAMLLGITVSAVQHARERSRREQCAYNMSVIGMAMNNYQDTYRSFPPAYVADKDGHPINSWRVIVGQFTGALTVWAQYQYDAPWDSPANRRFTAYGLDYCHCPSDPSAALNETNYPMIVGPGMFAEGQTPTRLDDIKDGTSNTIMVVETVGAKIPWAAPRDLEADKITFAVNGPQTPGISSNHSGGANCVFVDGAVRFLSNSMTPEQVRALCTRNGGEQVTGESVGPKAFIAPRRPYD